MEQALLGCLNGAATAVGYEKRTASVDGAFVLFDADATYKTTMWVARVKGF